jgi:hypothetical protein
LGYDGVTGMTPFSQTFPWGTHFQDFKTYENAVMPVMVDMPLILLLNKDLHTSGLLRSCPY